MGLLNFFAHAASAPLSSSLAVFSHRSVVQAAAQASNPLSTSQNTPSNATSGPSYIPQLGPWDCHYPDLQKEGFSPCNTGNQRACWQLGNGSVSNWDINTNYENVYPTGVTREYWLDVNLTPGVSPDGQAKVNGVTVNGTYPGPMIEACWGDLIKVHVRNHYQANGTTIHWHGVRQLGSNEMDGVNGVTQCPIAAGEEFTYEFRATQYGHSWYHSHYSLQYPDGVSGPIVIHGPTSADWDIDNGPIMISDWIHDTAWKVYKCEAYRDEYPFCKDGNSPPKSDSIVVNGIGPYKQPNGTFTNNYFRSTFVPGKKHLLRLINGSTASSYVFSIDNHTMTVVEADWVPVKPYQTDSLLVGIGQRYAVVVEADQKPCNYWMRTTPAAGCSAFRTDSSGEYTQVKETTAIVEYQRNDTGAAYPDTCLSVKQADITSNCTDESMKVPQPLVPIVPFNVTPAENDITPFTAAIEAKVNPNLEPSNPYAHWTLASDNLTSPLWLDFADPTILDPLNGTNPNAQIVRFDQSSGFVYMVLDGTFLKPNTSRFAEIPTAHPIHLHGTDFVIVGQSDSAWDPDTSPQKFVTSNPPRRDTAYLPSGGYLAVAFRPDNPGAWLMHCHIAWHASSGLALQVVVRPGDMSSFNGDLGGVKDGCKSWKAFDAVEQVLQVDSGI